MKEKRPDKLIQFDPIGESPGFFGGPGVRADPIVLGLEGNRAWRRRQIFPRGRASLLNGARNRRRS